MTAVQNKQILQAAFSELAKGNGRPFVEALADDVSWAIVGTTPWSKTFNGKKAVLEELLGPLNAQLAGRNTIAAHRFIAEDDYVVVEARGQNTTKEGKPYRNSYCWIFRMANGKVVDIVEYADTALVEAVLHPPVARAL